MDHCFRRLKFGLRPDNRLFTDCRHFDYRQVDVGVEDYDKKSTFLRYDVPLSYFEHEPVMLDLIHRWKLTPKIFLIAAGWTYDWHRDAFRYSPLNLMLDGNDDYLVLFCNKPEMRRFGYFPITKMVYDPNTFYMLNSQIPHCSINHGTVNRYLLTIAHFTKEPVAEFKQAPNMEPYYDQCQRLEALGLA